MFAQRQWDQTQGEIYFFEKACQMGKTGGKLDTS